MVSSAMSILPLFSWRAGGVRASSTLIQLRTAGLEPLLVIRHARVAMDNSLSWLWDHEDESMRLIEFHLPILYGQISVFDPHIDKPFNDWTPIHVAQGFSWRDGSVAFKTLHDSGSAYVTVKIGHELEFNEKSERTILVPYRVGANRLVEISSIDKGEVFGIDSGDYSLVFKTGRKVDDISWCDFYFIIGACNAARILRADFKIHPSYPLLMEAQPA
jgi:hypothetical protein